jgi:hypothetical protein
MGEAQAVYESVVTVVAFDTKGAEILKLNRVQPGERLYLQVCERSIW